MAKQPPLPLPIPNGYKVIFRASVRDRNGNVRYAWQYGKKAFRLVVPIED